MVNSRTVHLRVGRDIYRLDLLGSCQNFGWNNRIRLTTSGSSTVCTGPALGTSIVGQGAGGAQTCAVQTITALTPEEVAALPARDRP
jgi:hypothetical protein